MKFCGQCGQQIDDASMFCPYCGAAQAQQAPGPQAAPQQQAPQMPYGGPQPVQPQPVPGQPVNQPIYQQTPNQSSFDFKEFFSKIPLPVMIAVPSGIVVFIIVLALVFGGGGAKDYKGAVNNFYNAMVSGNSNKIVKSMFPSKMEKAFNKAAKKGDIDHFNYDSMQDYLDDEMDDYKRHKYEIDDVKIEDKEKMDRSDVRDLEKEIEDSIDAEIEIDEAYQVYASFRSREKGDKKWDEGQLSFLCYKVGRKWYAMPYSVFSF